MERRRRQHRRIERFDPTGDSLLRKLPPAYLCVGHDSSIVADHVEAAKRVDGCGHCLFPAVRARHVTLDDLDGLWQRLVLERLDVVVQDDDLCSLVDELGDDSPSKTLCALSW